MPPSREVSRIVSSSRSSTNNAGYVAFGGLPPVNVDARAFVSTPILIYESANSLVKSAGQRTRYTISVDGFVYNNQRGIATFHSNNVSAIVDTGASFLKVSLETLDHRKTTQLTPSSHQATSRYTAQLPRHILRAVRFSRRIVLCPLRHEGTRARNHDCRHNLQHQLDRSRLSEKRPCELPCSGWADVLLHAWSEHTRRVRRPGRYVLEECGGCV